MAALQRSVETFRRSGSSGLVWEERFEDKASRKSVSAGEGGDPPPPPPELQKSRSVGSAPSAIMERSRSVGGKGYKSGRVSPAIDPPSPKLPACVFCGIFGRPAPKTPKSKPKPAAAAVAASSSKGKQ